MAVSTLPNNWLYSNCYFDSLSPTNARSLPYPGGVDLTNQACVAACDSLGFPVAGTEYYGECWCGTNLPKTKATNASAECSFPCNADTSQICGGASRLSVYYKKGSTFTSTNPSIPNFVWRGCYVDMLNPRSFPYSSSVAGTSTTNHACTAKCNADGYAFAGTEHFGECYCSNSLLNITKSSGCAMPCLGDLHQICGDNALLTVFQSIITPSIAGWDYKGCFVDAQDPTRSLPVKAGSNMNNAQCVAACQSLGFPLAGTEYYGECWCGSVLPDLAESESECNTPCNNGPGFCGGSARLTLFQSTTVALWTPSPPKIDSWAYRGCYADVVDPRTFPRRVGVTNTTNKVCADACARDGYIYFGTEHFGECFCSNTIVDVAKLPDSSCTMPCNGNIKEVCGDNAALTVYSSTNNPPVPGFDYLGCFVDTLQPDRTLPAGAGTHLNNTGCAAACASLGFPFAGTEYYGECWCGSVTPSIPASAESCSTYCEAAPGTCGGPGFLTVFQSKTVAPFTPIAPNITCWAVKGCFVDSVNPRTFPFRASKGRSNQACTSSCATAGYKYAGTENFGECFCSNDISNAAQIADGSCTLPCKDDIHQICGDIARLLVYQRTCA
ncbi:WSC domain-containing protein [Zopfochytrium polystomum]|nr:WSC domain-containing protein [Zopfochytrium polystomum]